MQKKVKINVLSPGRFHVCDLSRELDKNGFDVRFYSFVPTRRAEKFGLPSKCNKSLFLFLLPFLVLERKLFKHSQWARKLRIKAQDIATGLYMRKCDICIAMTGGFVYAPKRAKKRGAIIVYERGSKHILEQKRILEAIPNWGKMNDWGVQRELKCYEMADYIALGSEHCRESFLIHKYPSEKLFVNNYGVDLSMFSPIEIEKQYDIIMVGGWSFQKGCDLIQEAVRKMNLKMLHVGGIVDCKFPTDNKFIHVEPVDQSILCNYYNQAKIFVMPSRQDGFGMVYSQAMACGLPIVGSPDSGAPDLKQIVDNSDCVVIIKEYTVDAVCEAIKEALRQYELLNGKLYAGMAIENLTWESYGKRYADWLNNVVLK